MQLPPGQNTPSFFNPAALGENPDPLPLRDGSKGVIAVVDDDPEMRSLIEDFLVKQGYRVQAYSEAPLFLQDLQKAPAEGFRPEIILSDIQMPHMTGLELTAQIRKIDPELPVVLVTAYGSLESAITALRNGAFDYVTKPFKLNELILNVERALSYRRLNDANRSLRTQLRQHHTKGALIGKSKGMQQVFELIERVSHVTANVLITGESGTGKEVVARTIHSQGSRASQPFVAVNCTAIPENLLESELFGHAKGSFTGAVGRKKGLFEEAEGGTLFLDEIGDMEISLQGKLLRVLQERKIRAVGDTVDREINVRIIAATHKDLKATIQKGLFREDLYYRLAVIPIHIPALRHRAEDIPFLAEYFLQKSVAQNKLGPRSFNALALNHLVHMRWDGNVRELENLIERIVVLSDHHTINEKDIPSPEAAKIEEFMADSTRDLPTIEQLEKRYIQVVMDKTGGKKDKASQILGINRRTLYRKEREYGLVDESHPEPSDEGTT